MAMQKKMIMVFRETQQNSESSTVEANSNRSALTPLLPPSSMLGLCLCHVPPTRKSTLEAGIQGGRHHKKNQRTGHVLLRPGCVAHSPTDRLAPSMLEGSKGTHTNADHYDLTLCLRYPLGDALSGLMPRVNLLSYNETLRRRQWGKGRMRNKERRKTNMKRNTLRKKRNGRTTRTNKWKKRKKTT